MKTIVKLSLSVLLLLFVVNMNAQETANCKVLNEKISGEYTGACKKGLAHGKGKSVGTDTYEGRFKAGHPHGFGTYTFATGEKYTGSWKKGKKQGLGKLIAADGNLVKEGIWKADKFVKEKEFPKYAILMKQNVQSVSIYKQNDGTDKIEIILFRDGKKNTTGVKSLLIDATSGVQDIASSAVFYTGVNYPFEATISFTAPGRFSKTTQTSPGKAVFSQEAIGDIDCKINIRIMEKGHWIVKIKY